MSFNNRSGVYGNRRVQMAHNDGGSDNTCGCYLVQGNSCQIAGGGFQYSFRRESDC